MFKYPDNHRKQYMNHIEPAGKACSKMWRRAKYRRWSTRELRTFCTSGGHAGVSLWDEWSGHSSGRRPGDDSAGVPPTAESFAAGRRADEENQPGGTGDERAKGLGRSGDLEWCGDFFLILSAGLTYHPHGGVLQQENSRLSREGPAGSKYPRHRRGDCSLSLCWLQFPVDVDDS